VLTQNHISPYEKFKAEADRYGDATFKFSSGVQNFNIKIFIKWNGETVIKDTYNENYPALIPFHNLGIVFHL